MTSLLPPTASPIAATTLTRGDRVGDPSEPDRDPAWQRAFEQAQAAEFGGWFKPGTPPPSASMQAPLASGDTAMRQSAVAMSIGLSSPSIVPASIRSAAGDATSSNQPSVEPSAPDDPTPPAAGTPTASLASNGASSSRPSLEPSPSARASGEAMAAPFAAHSIAPEPAPPTSVPPVRPVSPQQIIRTQPQSAVPPSGTASAAGPSPTGAAGHGTTATTIASSPAGGPPATAAHAVPSPNNGSTPSPASAGPVDVAAATPAYAFAQNLAASLEAALPVAVAVVASIAETAQPGATGVTLQGMAGALPPGAASSAAPGDPVSTSFAELADAASLGEDGAAETSPVFEAPAPSTTTAQTGGNLHEPVRLYAEWSDLGVKVWLGTDADQAQRLPILAQQVQQWVAGQGVRLLALVCNGRTTIGDSEQTAEPTAHAADGAAWEGGAELPKPRFVNTSDRF